MTATTMRSSGSHNTIADQWISMVCVRPFDNIKNDPGMLERHAKIGEAVRGAVVEAGLELYQETGFPIQSLYLMFRKEPQIQPSLLQ